MSFLINQDIGGAIKSFAIVGEKNKEIDEDIATIEAKLGSVESNAGLRFTLEAKRNDRDRTKAEHANVSSALDGKLRTHANQKIKRKRDYGMPIYNIENIKHDIKLTKVPSFVALTPVEQSTKHALLKQEAMPDIGDMLVVSLAFDELKTKVEPLLTKEIAPTKPIQELLNDSVLQMWGKQGMAHHRSKRRSCAFSRQALPDDIWQTLDDHFSKESDDLENDLSGAINSVNQELGNLEGLVSLRREQFYPEERDAFDAAKTKLTESLKVYKRDLEMLMRLLKSRKADLFRPVVLEPLMHNPIKIKEHVDSINTLIIRNNGKTKTLEMDKSAAREALRLTDVCGFASTIHYDAELDRIAELKSQADIAATAYAIAEREIREAEAEIQTLSSKQKDERKGANRVNLLLNNFFCHGGIKLEARDSIDKATVKSEITRDGKAAYNLSEGECSLIAFCYFIAKLEEPESKGKNLIIYIDDPISSLDGNHIFFMFSMIEVLIAKPIKKDDGSNDYRYKQLFVSTHNLDFLKYLKRLSVPRKKVPGASDKPKSVEDFQSFMIARSGASSHILPMPSYLKDYITEFHYLFHQIYQCRNQADAQTNHEPFFGFGNNLR